MHLPAFIVAFLFLSSAFSALAGAPILNPSHPDRYTVAKGDTLWDIASQFLADPWRWPQIWQRNPQIKNPDLIYPGDVIQLIYVKGEPRLILAREEFSERRLSPKIRLIPTEEAISTLPHGAIRPFLTLPKVVGSHELKNAPYVVGFAGEHVMGGAGDSIYARALKSSRTHGYTVFRPGDAYKDAETGEILGHQALFIANTRLQRPGDPATLVLTQTTREVLRGDRLLPIEEEKIELNFFPRAPEQEIRGHIISVLDGISQIGQYQIVIIDRGLKDGLEKGHVLDIFRKGAVIRDGMSKNTAHAVKLPDEKAGLLMVFRPFERVSYAIIMKATQSLHIFDVVKTP